MVVVFYTLLTDNTGLNVQMRNKLDTDLQNNRMYCLALHQEANNSQGCLNLLISINILLSWSTDLNGPQSKDGDKVMIE